MKSKAGAALGTLATVGAPMLFILTAAPPQPGKPPAYMMFWTLFGTSNQLLAALTLLGITVWLRRAGKPCWYTFLPMVFVMTITVWALVLQAVSGFKGGTSNITGLINAVVAVALLALAGLIVAEAVFAVRRPRETSPATATL